MFKQIFGKWLKRVGAGSSARLEGSAPSRMEGLEGRVLMASDGPRVLSIVADNRGLVNFQFDRTVEQTTLNTGDILILTAGKDRKLGTSDDVAQKISGTIYNTTVGANTGLQIGANLPANTPYRIVLVSGTGTGGIKGGNKKALDGESRGNGVFPTGDGVAGGNLDVIVTPTKKLTARISTSDGPIDVSLYNKSTPKSVSNFLDYANGGLWDASLFHRLIPGFILQGGSFGIDLKRNRTVQVPVFTMPSGKKSVPPVARVTPNEPGISNTVGTIAYSKFPNQPNSASNGFFFNLANNSSNLDHQNGGFTVFGAVANSDSQKVLSMLAQAGTEGTTDPNTGNLINPVTIAGKPFADVPMINTQTFEKNGRKLNPLSDLVRIFRVAVLEGIVATPGSKVLATPAAVRATTAVATPAAEVMNTGEFRAAMSGGSVFASGSPILHSDQSVLD